MCTSPAIIGIDNEFINLLSEICLDSIEGNFQPPELVKHRLKQYLSLVHALACKKKGKDLKKRLVQVR